MKIAVPTSNGDIYGHFGKCKEFTLFNVENNKIAKIDVIDTSDSGHSALAALMSQQNVNLLICGGIGGGAKMALAQYNVKVIPGVQGKAEEAVTAYLSGETIGNMMYECNHHDHNHGKDNHDCDCGCH